MPPKVPPRKSLSEIQDDFSQVLAKLSSPEGYEVSGVEITIDCSNVRKSDLWYKEDDYNSPAVKDPDYHSDYVDVYLDGKLIAEGEPTVIRNEGNEYRSRDGCGNYYCERHDESQYVFKATANDVRVVLHSKIVTQKHLFKKDVFHEIDCERLDAEHDSKVIHYYKGNVVCESHCCLFCMLFDDEITPLQLLSAFDEDAMEKHIEEYGF